MVALTDLHFMRQALALALRNLGQTWPNPSVGCIITKGQQIIGRGFTAPNGRPHAETVALACAGSNAQGATAYVTLEPCAHTAKTPPCASALVDAGIARVVVACRDPDPRVNGQGVAMLRKAGIEVVEQVCENEAKALNAGFFLRLQQNRPYVALKIATSLDGKIAYPPGHSAPRWLTAEAARAYGHGLRATHDAILTGIGTVLADDPRLTCRLPGLDKRSPVRVVLDSHLRIPPDSMLMKSASKAPLWVMTSAQAQLAYPVKTIHTPMMNDAAVILKALAQEGITRVLVEGGKAVTTSFVQSGLVDRIYWFRAPIIIGHEGMDGVGELTPPAHLTLIETRHLADDRLDIYDACINPALF